MGLEEVTICLPVRSYAEIVLILILDFILVAVVVGRNIWGGCRRRRGAGASVMEDVHVRVSGWIEAEQGTIHVHRRGQEHRDRGVEGENTIQEHASL